MPEEDPEREPSARPEPGAQQASSGGEAPAVSAGTLAMAVYVLYLVAPFVGGFTALVGVILAYVQREGAEPWLRTHYDNQISLFWWSLGAVAVSFVLAFIGIGVLLYLLWLVWLLVRATVGLAELNNRRALASPPSFLTGR
ncbi:DUF4870 family protein [Halorhodospira neutriphila]|uniref:Transmembrane protein n=1 Tax=Halorhodospira neutriphila TaxID=168379 RepID=A0ABS1E1V2_9GAMM|nr:hypothetical protein [Halorhodospira neutriphila]MBK1725760.1 hypothetical protein [Halorhodospira neutriphila]